MTTAMARETAEIPEAVDRLLVRRRLPSSAPPTGCARRHLPFAVVCGRGSSGHAGVYLRYLIETRLGIVVSATAPSIVTSYRKPSALRGRALRRHLAIGPKPGPRRSDAGRAERRGR